MENEGLGSGNSIADSHIPDFSANCAYAELFDARDSVVRRVKVGYENEAFSGYILIPEDVPEVLYRRENRLTAIILN